MEYTTKSDRFLAEQIDRLVKEQKETNELLRQLLKPPAKEVEPVEPDRVSKPVKRKRG